MKRFLPIFVLLLIFTVLLMSSCKKKQEQAATGEAPTGTQAQTDKITADTSENKTESGSFVPDASANKDGIIPVAPAGDLTGDVTTTTKPGTTTKRDTTTTKPGTTTTRPGTTTTSPGATTTARPSTTTRPPVTTSLPVIPPHSNETGIIPRTSK